MLEAARQRRQTTATHYETLRVSPSADAAEVRRAYLARARELHPDQHIGAPEAQRRRVERLMQELNAAWEVVGDPARRRAYDAGLRASRPRPTGPVVTSRPGAARPRATGPAPRVTTRVSSSYDPGVGSTEISGFAKLVRGRSLAALLAVFVAVAVVTALVSRGVTGDPTADEDRLEPPFAGAVVQGCIEIVPVVTEVSCVQSHDAVVWATAGPGEQCPSGTRGIFRPGVGGVYCVTRTSR